MRTTIQDEKGEKTMAYTDQDNLKENSKDKCYNKDSDFRKRKPHRAKLRTKSEKLEYDDGLEEMISMLTQPLLML